jgi:hypothetical protein
MIGTKNDIERIDEISLMIYNKDIAVFAEIEKIRKSIINLKIVAANLDNENQKIIKAFAEYLEDSIKNLQVITKDIKEYSKELGEICKKNRE